MDRHISEEYYLFDLFSDFNEVDPLELSCLLRSQSPIFREVMAILRCFLNHCCVLEELLTGVGISLAQSSCLVGNQSCITNYHSEGII